MKKNSSTFKTTSSVTGNLLALLDNNKPIFLRNLIIQHLKSGDKVTNVKLYSDRVFIIGPN